MPPPSNQISLCEKMKFTIGNINLGYFWYTNFWVQAPPPPPHPPLSSGICPGMYGRRTLSSFPNLSPQHAQRHSFFVSPSCGM